MKSVLVFDVDGTLTKPRNPATPIMSAFLSRIREMGKVSLAVVSGSDLSKITDQLGQNENGLMAHKEGQLIAKQNLRTFLGDEKIKLFVNWVLHYIADLDIPVKRGTFVEFRNGMINVCPIGRNCTQEERDAFGKFDEEHHIRKKMVEALTQQFPDLGLQYSIGGQISFDVFPSGWDKTFCLQFLKDFDKIFFFGDRCAAGGNDHEISIAPEVTKSFNVTGPSNTMSLVKELVAGL